MDRLTRYNVFVLKLLLALLLTGTLIAGVGYVGLFGYYYWKSSSERPRRAEEIDWARYQSPIREWELPNPPPPAVVK